MSSLDDHHKHENSEDCWCNPDVEAIVANDGYTRFLIVHNKVEITLDPDLDVEDARLTIAVCEDKMNTIDEQLARWWAVHEYAKLGS